jgi:hypothetical protein
MSKPRSTKSDDEHRDHTGGGPGSSHQGGSHGHATRDRADHGPPVDAPTNTRHSRTSGGGGERDSHHTHAPEQKGDRRGM